MAQCLRTLHQDRFQIPCYHLSSSTDSAVRWYSGFVSRKRSSRPLCCASGRSDCRSHGCHCRNGPAAHAEFKEDSSQPSPSCAHLAANHGLAQDRALDVYRLFLNSVYIKAFSSHRVIRIFTSIFPHHSHSNTGKS